MTSRPPMTPDANEVATGTDLAGILDAIELPLVVVDRECSVIRFNRAAESVLGFTSSDIRKPVRSLRMLPEVDDFADLCVRAIADGAACRREVQHGERSFLVRIAPHRDQNHQICGAVVTFNNVTAFRASLDQAIYEREYTKTILNTVGESLVILDADLRIQTANRAFYALLGVSREASHAVGIETLGDSEWKSSELWTLLRTASREHTPLETYELQCSFPSLGRRALIFDARPVSMSRNAGGSILLAIRDITERKRVEEALRVGEERYRRLNELLPVAVYTCDAPAAVITYYNATAVRLWGRSPLLNHASERFCGSFQIFRPNGTFLPHSECPMAVALREGRSLRNQEIVIARPDGTRVSALANIDPLLDADGRVVGAVNVLLDVSALKRVEAALREERNNLQTLLDTLPVAVFISNDPECRQISGNRAAAGLMRMQADAYFSDPASPEEPPTHLRVLRDGSVGPEQLPMQRAARGEIVRDEAVDYAFDDGTLCHTLVSARPLYDSLGKERGAIASMLDITGLRRAEHALREADRHKDEFLATLSHELRNPLAPLRTSLSILASSPDPESLRKTTDVMERQLNHLISLIDDLLDVSRISRGKVQLRKRRVELAPAIRQAIETIRPLAEARHHAIELSVPADPILLDADAVRLAQIFTNLLDNACKYSPEKGRIRLTVEVRPGEAVVSVRDSGIGIPRTMLESIFDMFAQGDACDGAPSGLGIGLALAKHLAELHAGSIVAHSDGAGCGSEFVVRLPTTSATELDATAHSAEAPSLAAARRRILVIDDNQDAAETLAIILEISGHEVQIAHDGPGAIERAATFRPQIIALDIGLPRMDGYEVCRALRKEPWGMDIVIVAITGWGQAEDRRKSSDAGFDAHLVKPIDPDSFLKLIERFSDRLDSVGVPR